MWAGDGDLVIAQLGMQNDWDEGAALFWHEDHGLGVDCSRRM